MKKIIVIKIFALILLILTFLSFRPAREETFSFDLEEYVDNILEPSKTSDSLILGEGAAQALFTHPAAPVLAAPPALYSIDGELVGVTAETADDIVIYIRIVDMDGAGSTGTSTWVSTTLQTVNGRYLWEADLGAVRTSDFSDYFIYSSSDRYEIEVFGPGGLLSQYAGTIADIEAHDPLSAEPIVPAITVKPITEAAQAEPTILSPAMGEAFSESRPTFTGSGPANTLLDIYIVGTDIRASINTDENGNWSWTPGSDIPPGEHVLRVEYRDERGVVLSTEINFTIISSPETGNSQPFYFITISAGLILTLFGLSSFRSKNIETKKI